MTKNIKRKDGQIVQMNLLSKKAKNDQYLSDINSFCYVMIENKHQIFYSL